LDYDYVLHIVNFAILYHGIAKKKKRKENRPEMTSQLLHYYV
jgi:hypothetical protein